MRIRFRGSGTCAEPFRFLAESAESAEAGESRAPLGHPIRKSNDIRIWWIRWIWWIWVESTESAESDSGPESTESGENAELFVRPSVRASVCASVRPSVRHTQMSSTVRASVRPSVRPCRVLKPGPARLPCLGPHQPLTGEPKAHRPGLTGEPWRALASLGEPWRAFGEPQRAQSSRRALASLFRNKGPKLPGSQAKGKTFIQQLVCAENVGKVPYAMQGL
eukprot:gene16811-biopygen784